MNLETMVTVGALCGASGIGYAGWRVIRRAGLRGGRSRGSWSGDPAFETGKWPHTTRWQDTLPGDEAAGHAAPTNDAG